MGGGRRRELFPGSGDGGRCEGIARACPKSGQVRISSISVTRKGGVQGFLSLRPCKDPTRLRWRNGRDTPGKSSTIVESCEFNNETQVVVFFFTHSTSNDVLRRMKFESYHEDSIVKTSIKMISQLKVQNRNFLIYGHVIIYLII